MSNYFREANVQANYTAAMGSTMGTMLWKTSKTEEIIQTFIDTVRPSLLILSLSTDLFLQGTIQEFIIMSNITLNSFMDSFKENLPNCESYEYKFILSVIGEASKASAFASNSLKTSHRRNEYQHISTSLWSRLSAGAEDRINMHQQHSRIHRSDQNARGTIAEANVPDLPLQHVDL